MTGTRDGRRGAGRQAARCIFVDDLPSNLAGARTAGMAFSLFDVRDPCGSLRRIKQRLDA